MLLPALFLAVRFKTKFPPIVGVPEIKPVVELMLSPLFEGRLALYERIGGFVAVIWWVKGVTTAAVADDALVIIGITLAMLMVRFFVRLLPTIFVARKPMVVFPAVVGVPRIVPVEESRDKPITLKLPETTE